MDGDKVVDIASRIARQHAGIGGQHAIFMSAEPYVKNDGDVAIGFSAWCSCKKDDEEVEMMSVAPEQAVGMASALLEAYKQAHMLQMRLKKL